MFHVYRPSPASAAPQDPLDPRARYLVVTDTADTGDWCILPSYYLAHYFHGRFIYLLLNFEPMDWGESPTTVSIVQLYAARYMKVKLHRRPRTTRDLLRGLQFVIGPNVKRVLEQGKFIKKRDSSSPAGTFADGDFSGLTFGDWLKLIVLIMLDNAEAKKTLILNAQTFRRDHPVRSRWWMTKWWVGDKNAKILKLFGRREASANGPNHNVSPTPPRTNSRV